MLKARISLCKVEPPDIQTYRHFLTHIAICSGIGEIPISEVPAEFAKVLSKGSEVIIPCTMSAKLSESIAKYCKDVEKEIFYIKLSPL